MRKLLYLCLTGLLTLGCTKAKLATEPSDFKIEVDWVKGTRAQFTITPSDPNVCYAYGTLEAEHPMYDATDEEIVNFQLEWMDSDYESLRRDGKVEGDFVDLFCFIGPRTLQSKLMSPDTDQKLLVFQIHPETHTVLGPLHKLEFHTQAVPEQEIDFTIQYKDNMFRILPSDKQMTWFWEYERNTKIEDVYMAPYFFFYDIICMYDDYGFLDNLLSKGDNEYVLPQDDPSIQEGVLYTMMMSACSDGEISSPVSYAEFIYENGKVRFVQADVPVEPLP